MAVEIHHEIQLVWEWDDVELQRAAGGPGWGGAAAPWNERDTWK